MENSKLTILVDIDSILDVRYGKLRELDPNIGIEVAFKNVQYYNRTHDDFWHMFSSISKEAYSNKVSTKETLKLSPRTNIFEVVDRAINGSNVATGEEKEIKIIVNTLGYGIDSDGIHALEVLTSARFDHKYKVEVVDLTLDELTPKYLEEEIDLAIIYDFNGWIALQQNKLTKKPLSKVVFYIPAIFINKQEADRHFMESIKASGVEGDPLEIISEYIWERYRMNIHFIKARYYSTLILE